MKGLDPAAGEAEHGPIPAPHGHEGARQQQAEAGWVEAGAIGNRRRLAQGGPGVDQRLGVRMEHGSGLHPLFRKDGAGTAHPGWQRKRKAFPL